MPSVYARGKRWWIRVKVDGRWTSKSTPPEIDSRTKAERYAAAAQSALDGREVAGKQAPLTVAAYAARWLAARLQLGLRTAAQDAGRFRKHVLPHLGALRLDEVRPRHVRDMIRALRQSGELAPRTILAIAGLTHTMFADAVVDEIIAANPCVFRRGELPARVDSDSEWRGLATYTVREIEQLISDDRIPPERRVQYALKAIAGLRHGEVAGLRWRLYDPTLEPLGRLLVATSYDRGQTKTEVTKRVPVHPTLARILAAWRLEHWPRIHGRAPGPDDLVVPTRRGTMVSKSDANVAMKRDLAELGLRLEAGSRRKRGGHDLRSWFITTCQEHGAHRDLLRVVTHASRGDVVSGYTRAQWPALCAEVSKLRVSILGGEVLRLATAHATAEPHHRKRWVKGASTPGARTGKSDTTIGQDPPVLVGDPASPPMSSDVERAATVASLATALADAVLVGDQVTARRLAGEIRALGAAPGAFRRPA